MTVDSIDWTASMQQTFEFYTVDPATWGNMEKLDEIISASITRSDDDEVIETANIECTRVMDECYVRIYLICIQNGSRFEFPLGTFLVQTPQETNDGKNKSVTMEAYSPLLELKDTKPPYGYTVFRNSNILETVSDIVLDNARCPVTKATSTAPENYLTSDIVSDFENDTWLSFANDLLGNVDYTFALDEMGRVLFRKRADASALTPIWTYDDGNSSILYPDITYKRDLYGIPNVVEVLYSDENGFEYAMVENTDENSPVSIPSRGRRVVHRVSNPQDLTNPTKAQVEDYAAKLLRDMSTLEYTISYTHGYCPVRVGDAVWINYERAGLTNIRAVVTGQSITCRPGCPVSETAVFTSRLWGEEIG